MATDTLTDDINAEAVRRLAAKEAKKERENAIKVAMARIKQDEMSLELSVLREAHVKLQTEFEALTKMYLEVTTELREVKQKQELAHLKRSEAAKKSWAAKKISTKKDLSVTVVISDDVSDPE
jgi:thioredoxin-like negative regulator of GroEL